MTWITWIWALLLADPVTFVLCVFAALPPALAVAYGVYIQFERGGLWTVFRLAGLIGWPLDFVANYTTLALLFWAWPGRNYTFSKQLERHLVKDIGLRGFVAWRVAKVINWIAPSGKHIDMGVIQDV